MFPDQPDTQGECQLSSSDPSLPADTLHYSHHQPSSSSAPESPPTNPKTPGSLSSEAILHDVRFEHYEILRREDGTPWELGRGAMGVTYKAFDTRLHYPVALKVIHMALLRQHAVMRERFLREARVTARLRHPNIASVFHLGERADGQCFYVMELIEGETLAERVRRRGPLPAAQALEVAMQAAQGLIAAAQADLVHRDLKPANLMLMSSGMSGTGGPKRETMDLAGSNTPGDEGSAGSGTQVKIIDFGLARVISEGDGEPLTTLGGFVGTPQYASPEQLAPDEQPIDARSDIYSLGSTLWYALCGKQPFSGGSLEEIYRKQLRRTPPLAELQNAGVPAPMIAVLQSMLSADPDERPASPHALAEILHRCRQEMSSAGDGLGVARGSTVLLPPVRRRESSLYFRVAAAGALLLLAALASWMAWNAYQGRLHFEIGGPASLPVLPGASGIPEKSVAVLPFDNLSEDKENAFFADGIQDDLLTSLAKISELRVISRTSVLAYRDDARRGSLREIGRALSVANIVEGSVRRSGNHVRVTVQLIDTRDDHHLWAETYDREMNDMLTLQSELAREIANALRATLSPAERERVEIKPTSNPDAYVLFLRAREYGNEPDFALASLKKAEDLFTQAVTLDPNFALAYARLSRICSQIAFNYEPTDARHAQARAAAEQALRLQPNLGEAHLALGYCYYWADLNYEAALAEFAIAAQALPNEAEVLRAIGYVQRRQGRWDEAINSFRRAAVLGPRDVAMQEGLAHCYYDRREWAAAAEGYERAAALGLNGLEDKLTRARIEYHWKGNLALMRDTLAALTSPPDPEGLVSFSRYDLALLDGDYPAAENALAGSPLEAFPLGISTQFEKNFLRGFIYLARDEPGDADRARQAFEASRAYYEKDFQRYPQDALRVVDLGLVYAALGWRDAALSLSEYAAALRPEARDAVGGSTVTLRRARLYALLGDVDNALSLAQHLLVIPVDEWNGFSVQDIRLRPEWKTVRGDARFQKLIAEATGK